MLFGNNLLIKKLEPQDPLVNLKSHYMLREKCLLLLVGLPSDLRMDRNTGYCSDVIGLALKTIGT